MRPIEIKALRKRLGISQRELAKVLGCGDQTVQSWEQGTRHPGEVFAERLDNLSVRSGKLKPPAEEEEFMA